ncbi:MAG: GNAT family N-acetyltransferase [Parcubacteria group bacterium]|nr:GNAT family N-acetyltransferase [Parcubacteria group bacterium]
MPNETKLLRPAIRTGKNIILRPPTKADIPKFLVWFNDPEINGYLNRYLPVYERDEELWLESLQKNKETDIVFVIETIGGVSLGTVGLHRIHWKDRTGVLGIAIGEKKYWNKGIGTEAIMLLLDYAFNALNLRKITLSVLGNNKRGQACYHKCGFIVEGCCVREIYKNGRYEDEILMAVFKKGWRSLWKKYKNKP